jgi:hypothetical protein
MNRKQGYNLINEMVILLRKMKDCVECSLGELENITSKCGHDKKANQLISKAEEFMKFKEN